MRILIAADTYYPHANGASYFAQRLAQYLQKRGHSVVVIAPSESPADTKNNMAGVWLYGMKSIPVFFHSNFRFSLPILKNTIEKIIDEFKPDIIHLQSHFAINRIVLKVGKAKRIPIVATNHFMPENLIHYLPFPELIKDNIKRLAWLDFARVFNQTQQITTPTETAAKLIRNKVKPSVKVISCGIDLKRFQPRSNKGDLKKRYKLPHKPLLLYVGRLDKEKNLALVLQAVAQANKKVDFHFAIAGRGAESKHLENLTADLKLKNHVTFLGFVEDKDLPNLYACADVFIIAGAAELQSIVTMEALASGLPVIGANAMALPELVKDGENGFLFELSNLRDLDAKITKLFSKPKLRKAMGERSLEIIAKHNIAKIISEFETVYAEVLAKQAKKSKQLFNFN